MWHVYFLAKIHKGFIDYQDFLYDQNDHRMKSTKWLPVNALPYVSV